MSHRSNAWWVLLALAALAGLETCRLGNPAPAPVDAPAEEFSATRALTTLRQVALDAPHPLGTPAHDLVRDRIAAAFRALDYRVETQRAFACSAAALCGTVDNLIATRPDRPDRAAGRKAVVVAAHYDSVPAGPGASDDATGVASALEIARAVRRDPPANPVVFFIDDGEEAGLLGAEAWMSDPARAAALGFVINMEARGTTGAPFLFETSRDNAWLIPVVARALPRPVTTSLFATIYDLLPNDTDLTVFKRAGRAGINFAYLGGGTQYHTPLDDFAHVDPGSVQRRGDQVLAMLRAFAAETLPAAPSGDAVWFDVFAGFVVWWPVGWSLWIALAALALLGAAAVIGLRRRELTIAGLALGVASWLAALALAAALGAALSAVFGLRAGGALFAPHPEPMLAAAWLVGLAAALGAAGLARRWAPFAALFIGHAVAWNGLAIAAAILLPGAAYLAVVPGAIMAVFAVLRGAVRAPDWLASLAALVGAATVVLPFALIGYDALAGTAVVAAALLLALVGTAFAPLIADSARRLAPALAGLAALAGAIAMLVPNRSDSHPRQLSLAHVTDGDTGATRWQVARATPELRAAAAFEPTRRSVAPWFGARGEADVAPAPRAAIAPPVATVTTAAGAGGTRLVTLDVASARGAPRITIAWRSDAVPEAIRINGVALPPPPARFRRYLAPGWNRIVATGAPAHVELTLRGTAPAEAIISDTSFGLPPEPASLASALIAARTASGAVPVHDGDVTIAERHLRW